MSFKDDLQIPYGKEEYDRILGLSDEEFNKEFQEELEKAIQVDRDLDMAVGEATFGNLFGEEFGGNHRQMVEEKYKYFKEQRNERKVINEGSKEIEEKDKGREY